MVIGTLASRGDPGTVTATWNGVSMTAAHATYFSGDVEYLTVFYLLTPATGSHNMVFSTTNSSRQVGFAYSLTGAGSVGTPATTGGSGPGTRTTSVTISTGDMVFGALASAIASANLTMLNNNTAQANDADNFVVLGVENNTGNGSVSVSSLISSSPGGSIMFALPIIQTTISAPPQNGTVTLFGDW